VRLYHRATDAGAAAILAEGFKTEDGDEAEMADALGVPMPISVVRLAEAPLGQFFGAHVPCVEGDARVWGVAVGDGRVERSVLLELDLNVDEDDVAVFEVVLDERDQENPRFVWAANIDDDDDEDTVPALPGARLFALPVWAANARTRVRRIVPPAEERALLAGHASWQLETEKLQAALRQAAPEITFMRRRPRK